MMAYIMQPMETVCECGCNRGCVCLFDLQLHKAFEREKASAFLFSLVEISLRQATRILLNGRCECKRRENTTAAGIWQCQTAVHCIASVCFPNGKRCWWWQWLFFGKFWVGTVVRSNWTQKGNNSVGRCVLWQEIQIRTNFDANRDASWFSVRFFPGA